MCMEEQVCISGTPEWEERHLCYLLSENEGGADGGDIKCQIQCEATLRISPFQSASLIFGISLNKNVPHRWTILDAYPQ